MRRVTRPSASAELARSATARPSAKPPAPRKTKKIRFIHPLPPSPRSAPIPPRLDRAQRASLRLGPPPRAAPRAAATARRASGGRRARRRPGRPRSRLSLPASTARSAPPSASGRRHRAPRLRQPSRSPEAGKRPANPLGFLGFWPPRASSTEPRSPSGERGAPAS
ncbi:hypothetical protein GUJ93_ZPchr0012g20192 [Zizania palustris]|uniref:Uncharacterized protein n=1 Tax=Zizania palustris TaxID=103762 RepID=A0A8J6BSW4_ZIZPA|nr:hypothetical protein GUJ93_ZPchr0012g20192 [Zizania palustris]